MKNGRAELPQGDRILSEIKQHLSRFIVYPSEHAKDAHVLWIAHAHLSNVFACTPRLLVWSPEKECGKTRVLEMTATLVPNPIMSVNVSTSYLFRRIGDQDNRPTILFDEIDTIFGSKQKENAEEIRGLVNAGHKRGAVVGRNRFEGKNIVPEEIEVYGPIALAGKITGLDDTLVSRSVVIRMRRRKRGEAVEGYRFRIHEPQGHALRDQLAEWAAMVGVSLEDKFPELPAGIEDRNADKWEPLIAVADAAGGVWPERARQAAMVMVRKSNDAEPSDSIRLLMDLREVFGQRESMLTETLLHELQAIKESPWGDSRNPLTSQKLAQLLRRYEIKSKQLWTTGNINQRGYKRADLSEIWDIYLPDVPTPPGKAARGASPLGSEPEMADLADDDAENISNNNLLANLADLAPFPGGVGADLSIPDFLLRQPSGEHSAKCACCGHEGDGTFFRDNRDGKLVHMNCQAAWYSKHPLQ